MLDATVRALEQNVSHIRGSVSDIQGKCDVLSITLQDISYTLSAMHTTMKFQAFFLGLIALLLMFVISVIGVNFLEDVL